MHRHKGDMLLVAEPQKLHTKQRAAFEIERPIGLLLYQPTYPAIAACI
jgi:hypothetical protein